MSEEQLCLLRGLIRCLFIRGEQEEGVGDCLVSFKFCMVEQVYLLSLGVIRTNSCVRRN